MFHLSTVLALCITAYAANIPSPLSRRAIPDPICTGVCTGTIRDPYVLRRDDGTWFRFTTEGNIRIATAPSISGPWSTNSGEAGALLPGGSIIHLSDDQRLWAPNVFYSNGLFYNYYTVSQIGSQNSAIGVATSATADPGTWTDHGSIDLPANSQYNRIDANFFRTCATCTPYLYFGSSWDGVFQTTLTSDLLKWSGESPINIVKNTTFPAVVVKNPYPSIVEAPFMWWLPIDGTTYFWMFFSSGACCNTPSSEGGLEAPGDEYKIMACRSTSINGPWKDKDSRDCATENGGSVVLRSHGDTYAPGGQGVAYDPDSNRYALYYHYVNKADGTYDDFRFGFNWVDFSTGWPEVVE
ncbi:glycoside hydrolase family 43 protein [Pleomassaria siparia CBS 279.74]|uniref:Arabinan endo-1,5-alpha-L-arabinosidase n=1 Tax=Pleomassaria siparia CBS 279.74 TaxID=1314801 RepID=A0A6G1KIC9_9PLEO|nr:glycoside hydrolase family 43 protein [Pleomassaria siparia CBS 279.74]